MWQVAFFRGINVGGNRKLPMAALREIARGCGFSEPSTYLNSGNLVFNSGRASAKSSAERIGEAIEREFGFEVDVFALTLDQCIALEPPRDFERAARDRPNHLLVGISRNPCSRDAAKKLSEWTSGGEQILLNGDYVWIDFQKGIGRSKLTPDRLEKAIGSPVTFRNWRTVKALAGILTKLSNPGFRK